MLKKLTLAFFAALWATAASAQSVQQISPVTRNHIPVWVDGTVL